MVGDNQHRQAIADVSAKLIHEPIHLVFETR